MKQWTYFSWLGKQSADALLWAWPVTIVLLACMLGALIYSRRELRNLWQPRWLWQLGPVMVPFATLALGTWFACENCSPSALGDGHRYPWAMRTADALLVSQLLAAGWLVKAASPLRWFAASFQFFIAWCSFWAAFLAGMSMSGDWL
jgi:hypothetical protein